VAATGVIISNTFAAGIRLHAWITTVRANTSRRSTELTEPILGTANDPTNYFSGIWTNGYCQASKQRHHVHRRQLDSISGLATRCGTPRPICFDTSYLGGGAPEYTFAVIWSNTTNTLTLQPSKMVRPAYTAPFLTFYDGDTYQFSRVIRTLDQTGWVRAT